MITPIDFDHQIYLGNTLRAIAGEKAGILKSGSLPSSAKQRPQATQGPRRPSRRSSASESRAPNNSKFATW